MLCPIVELAIQLIRRRSISPNDEGCQEIIVERLKAIGFTIEYMNFGDTKNLWVQRGKGKTLVFAGHTDVVPVGKIDCWVNNPFEPTIRHGLLFGRGAADMKGSLAAMVIAAERFITAHPNHKGRLAFLITSDEETNAKNGTIKVIETLMARNERLDYCLVGEPSSTRTVGDVIKNGRRGSLTCYLIVHGIQGHVAYPHLADNPIHRIIPMLKELIDIKWDQGNNFFPATSMQIINIKSGTGMNNIIPDDLFVQFNFRFNTELTEKEIKLRIITLLKKHRLQYTIKWQLFSQPFITKKGKLIDAVIDTVLHFNKIKPKILTTGGTSDAQFIVKMTSQIVELGLVNATVHKTNECVKIKDLQLLAFMYQSIMEKLIT